MLESQPSGTLRLLAASSTRKGRWVRHHQMEDTLPKKNRLKNRVKNEPKNRISRKTALRALFRGFLFFLSFLTSFWLCFSGKNKMKNKTKNSQKNATVNYPIELSQSLPSYQFEVIWVAAICRSSKMIFITWKICMRKLVDLLMNVCSDEVGCPWE